MDLRFEDAPEQAIQIMRECIKKYFPELLQAKILILMDTKKRESQRAIVLGRILKTNDLHRICPLKSPATAMNMTIFYVLINWRGRLWPMKTKPG